MLQFKYPYKEANHLIKKSMFGVFQNRNYLKLFLAGFASNLGSVAGMFAFTLYLLKRFGDQPYYTNLTELMYSLPTLFVFFIVGVVADRMDRQKIAASSDWIRAVLTLLLLVAVQIGWIPLVFAVLFARSAVARFFETAQSALIQGILEKEDMVSAVGLNSTLASLFMLFGNGIGAALYWTVGVEGAILVDAISFVISALLIRACRISTEARLPNGHSQWRDLKFGMVLSDFKIGSLYVWRYRLLLMLMVGLFVLGFVNGFASVLPMFMLKYKLAPQNYEVMGASLSIAFGVGYLVGSPISTMLAKKFPLHRMMTTGFFLMAVLIFCQGLITSPYLFVFMDTLIGFTVTVVNVAFFGWFPQIVDPRMMGRVNGWRTPLMLGAQSITLTFVAVVFPGMISIANLFFVESIIMLLIAVFYLITLPRLVKREENSDHIVASLLGTSSTVPAVQS
jgi:MFS transporter, DHA3 family, macrolide efflux protein